MNKNRDMNTSGVLNLRGVELQVVRDFKVGAARLGLTHPVYLARLVELHRRLVSDEGLPLKAGGLLRDVGLGPVGE